MNDFFCLLMFECGNRYAINDDGMDWSGAETQIKSNGGNKGRSMVVSVKKGVEGGEKRKAEGEVEVKESKKSRRSKKVKR